MSIFKKITKYKKRIAVIIDGSEKISYSKLIQDSMKVTKKIKSRSLILILAGNNYETISSYIGLMNKESAILIIDKNISQNFLYDIVKRYKPNYIYRT